MADRQLKFLLTGEDKSASSTLGKVGDAGESASSKIGKGFSKLGSTIGGEFGEVLNKIGEGLEKTGEHGMSMSKKFAVGGAAVMGVGALLMAAGSKEKQATDQLKAAIDATGGAYSDYSEEIEKTVKHEENYAHSAVDTKTALQTLTTATGDTQKALDQMQVVTDLAAAKHESLSEAATQVAKILGGSGGKILTLYGIKMKTNADGTKDVSGALDELAAKLKGQASASMDNFGAKVDAVKVKVGDFIAEWGGKLGGSITVAGAALEGTAAAMDLLAARSARGAAAAATLAAANTAEGAAATGAAAANTALAASEDAAAAGGVGMVGSLGIIGGVLVGGYAATKLLGDKTDALANSFATGKIMASQNEKGIDDLKNAYFQLNGVSATGTDSLLKFALSGKSGVLGVGALSDKVAELIPRLGGLGITTGDLSTALSGNDGAFDALIAKVKEHGGASAEDIRVLDELHLAFVGTAGSTDDLTAATAAAAKQQKDLGTQIRDITSTSLTATAQLNDMSTALDKLSNNSIDAEQQELQLKDALAGATDQVKANGGAINDTTVKGRSNTEWVLTQIKAINTHAVAVGKQTGSVKQATAALGSDTAQLRQAAAAAGLNKKQVDALIKTYGATPKQVRTAILADTAAAAKKIKDLQAQIDALRGRTVTIITQEVNKRAAGGSGTNLALRDSGGPVTAGTPYLIGVNRRPEVFIPGQSGRIEPIHAASTAGVGGHTYININLTGLYGAADAGRALVGMLEKYVGAGGQINVSRGIR